MKLLTLKQKLAVELCNIQLNLEELTPEEVNYAEQIEHLNVLYKAAKNLDLNITIVGVSTNDLKHACNTNELIISANQAMFKDLAVTATIDERLTAINTYLVLNLIAETSFETFEQVAEGM